LNNKEMRSKEPLAVIWDFDGTLVDTSRKNLNVTQEILRHIKPAEDPSQLPALADLESYLQAGRNTVNWRDFYRKHFLLDEQQTDLAGKLWTEFQLKDDTEISFFPDMKEVIRSLGHLPQGIVSQNSKDNIIKLLGKYDLLPYFTEIIGYEEVHLKAQKPAPDGLLKCIEKITGDKSGIIYYVGDHETDIVCAFNANEILKKRGIKVDSIAAFYGFRQNTADWQIQPDHTAFNASEILNIIPHAD